METRLPEDAPRRFQTLVVNYRYGKYLCYVGRDNLAHTDFAALLNGAVKPNQRIVSIEYNDGRGNYSAKVLLENLEVNQSDTASFHRDFSIARNLWENDSLLNPHYEEKKRSKENREKSAARRNRK